MKSLLFSTVLVLIIGGICLADDPGDRDSLIVETVYAELGDSTVDVRIYVTCDDSVVFYNFPLTWIPFNDSSIHFTGITYYNTLLFWDDTYDSLIYEDGFIRMLGFSDICGAENPPLYTYNNRLHCWTLHIAIDSLDSPQVVIIDTTFDPINESLLFGLFWGVNQFTPEFVPGAIYYGVTSDNPENPGNVPYEFFLSQNYPNPFNASTTIKFTLAEESEIELVVYDLLGRKVAFIFKGVKAAGKHSIIWNADDAPSGIYFYQLSSEGHSLLSKMTLIR